MSLSVRVALAEVAANHVVRPSPVLVGWGADLGSFIVPAGLRGGCKSSTTRGSLQQYVGRWGSITQGVGRLWCGLSELNAWQLCGRPSKHSPFLSECNEHGMYCKSYSGLLEVYLRHMHPSSRSYDRSHPWMMMMTFITQGGEGQRKTKKKRKATKSKGRSLEVGASRALMLQVGEEGCGWM